MEEYDRAVKKVRAKSAPVRDGIGYGMTKELLRFYKQELLNIFNDF